MWAIVLSCPWTIINAEATRRIDISITRLSQCIAFWQYQNEIQRYSVLAGEGLDLKTALRLGHMVER